MQEALGCFQSFSLWVEWLATPEIQIPNKQQKAHQGLSSFNRRGGNEPAKNAFHINALIG